ncbi:MAG: hypothetical protein ACR2M4_00580 [Actinomycetota bacterium]
MRWRWEEKPAHPKADPKVMVVMIATVTRLEKASAELLELVHRLKEEGIKS